MSSSLTSSFLRGGDGHGDGVGNTNTDEAEPTDAVLRLSIRGDDWPSLLARLRTHPTDASYKKRRTIFGGQVTSTPLHESCYHRHVPPEVIRALLHLDPDAAAVRNGFGKLPLHVACWHKVGYEVLRAILEAYPDAATATDGRGRTPIKSLWAGKFGNNADLRLMNDLSRVIDPAEFALDEGVESSDARVTRMNEYYSDSDDDSEEEDEECDDPIHRRRRMGEFWMSAVLLLDAAHNRSGEDGDSVTVSRHLPPDHPLLVLRAASALDRMDMDSQRDGNERSNSRSGLERLVSRMMPTVLARADVPIIPIIGSEEDGDDGLPRSRRGRYLLHLAAEDGLTWEGGARRGDDGDVGDDGENPTCENDMGIVQRVLRAFPGAVSERDPDTGMYPFMLSAVALAVLGGDEEDDASSWSSSHSNSTSRIGTVFNLLLADPSLVARSGTCADGVERMRGRCGWQRPAVAPPCAGSR